MSFVYGTNCELLYSMPAVGASLAVNTKQIISATTATNPPFFLPPLYNIWSPSQMAGKALHFEAAGGYDTSGAANNTMQLYFDTAFSTATNVIAQTGAIAWGSLTTGAWGFSVDMTCTASGMSVSTWQVSGQLFVGNGASTTTGATVFSFGNSVTAGVPAAVTLLPGTSYCPEIYSTFSANLTAMVCSQYQVWALN
jgi:hypothetical protein